MKSPMPSIAPHGGAILGVVLIFLSVVLCAPQHLKAQSKDSREESNQVIEDNSFFIEEAYNQEERVVQHIFSAMRYYGQSDNNLAMSFTQEWPVFGQTHQLSITVPYLMATPSTDMGLGDLMINYRYQLLTKEDFAAFAPRFTLILPVADVDKGLGMGTVGCQVNLPFSKRLTDHIVAHLNAGITSLPGAQAATSTGRVTSNLTWTNTGASLIWLATPLLNIMLESAQNYTSAIEDDGTTSHSTEFILSPGIRYAINLGTLQIVPGIAVPFSFIGGDERSGAFLYLSFEHPY